MNQYQTNGNGLQPPIWLENGRINEIRFLQAIRDFSYFRVVRGKFYDSGEHLMEDAAMKRIITDELARGITNGLNTRTKDLLELMRYQWNYEVEDCSDRYIHVRNGTLDLYSGTFSEKKEFTIHRLQANYLPDSGKPERFLSYLQDLLEEEDILTLQEYLGYCLIPTTKAQKMLVISGKGGEGKSVLGQIVAAVWGEQALFSSIQKIATDRFARASLMDRLLMVDDDMSLEALPQTHLLKTLITLNGKTDVEMKGVQSFQTPLYARFLGFTNGTLSSLYDRSDGFYRRIIFLKTKDRPADRVDYPYLAESILYEELDAIFFWCYQGLNRLLGNGLQFTISLRARQNLEEIMRDANPVLDFLDSTGYLVYDPMGSITCADLLELFRQFCSDNGYPEMNIRTAQRLLKQHLQNRGIRESNHVPHRKAKSVRGYLGIRLLQPVRWTA